MESEDGANIGNLQENIESEKSKTGICSRNHTNLRLTTSLDTTLTLGLTANCKRTVSGASTRSDTPYDLLTPTVALLTKFGEDSGDTEEPSNLFYNSWPPFQESKEYEHVNYNDKNNENKMKASGDGDKNRGDATHTHPNANNVISLPRIDSVEDDPVYNSSYLKAADAKLNGRSVVLFRRCLWRHVILTVCGVILCVMAVVIATSFSPASKHIAEESPPGDILVKLNEHELPYPVSDMALTNQTDLIMVKQNGRELGIFTSDGELKQNITIPDAERLWGVARKGDRIYVTDRGSETIHVLKEDGSYLTSKQVSREPAGVALNQTSILITSCAKEQIYRFNIARKPVNPIVKFKLNTCPQYIAMDHSYIAVSGYKSHTLHVYNLTLRLVFKYGSFGTGHDQLLHPQGVAMDTNGRIYLADWGNSRLVVLSVQGKVLTRVMQEDRPQALLVHQDVLYVTTASEPAKLLIFKIAN